MKILFFKKKNQIIKNNNLENTALEKKIMNRKSYIYTNKSNVPGAEIHWHTMVHVHLLTLQNCASVCRLPFANGLWQAGFFPNNAPNHE